VCSSDRANAIIVKESKEKKIKEDNKNILVPSHLVDVWSDFLDMRKKIRKPATDKAQMLIIDELEKLAPRNFQLQVSIIEQSISNSWQGVFPIKDKSLQSRQLFGKKLDTEEESKAKFENIFGKGWEKNEDA
jgi:hypothetical protein